MSVKFVGVLKFSKKGWEMPRRTADRREMYSNVHEVCQPWGRTFTALRTTVDGVVLFAKDAGAMRRALGCTLQCIHTNVHFYSYRVRTSHHGCCKRRTITKLSQSSGLTRQQHLSPAGVLSTTAVPLHNCRDRHRRRERSRRSLARLHA